MRLQRMWTNLFVGATIIGILVYGLIYYWQWVFFIGVFAGGWYLWTHRARHCDLCHQPIQRTAIEIEISGQKGIACPNCAAQIRRRISQQAVKQVYQAQQAQQAYQPPPNQNIDFDSVRLR